MHATNDNTIVIIPSYNEARTIGKIVRDITAIGLSVLVIDDGSADETEKEALDNGAMVIRNKANAGKGYSLKEGFKYVFDKTKYEWLVMMDGDGQHHPEDVPALMTATGGEDVDIVLGNRMEETDDMPRDRYLTNKFTSWTITRMCGQKIPDSQCGFRLIRLDAFRDIDLTTDKYDFESEMLIVASASGLRISSVPIKTIYGDEVSEIDRIKDTLRFFRLIFKHLLFRHK